MNLIWFSGSKIIILISRIILLMWTSRNLSSNDFGVFHSFNVLISLLMIFPNVGIGSSLIQRKNLKESHINTAFTFLIVFSIILSIALFVLKDAIASLFNIEQLREILRVLFWFPLLIMLTTVSKNLVLKKLKIKAISLIELSSYILVFIPAVFIVFNYYKQNYMALVIPYILQLTYESIAYLIINKRLFAFQFKIKSMKELMTFGGYNSLGTVFGMLGNQADGFLIGKFLGASTLGYYNRAYSIMSILQNIYSQYIDKVMFAEFSSLKSEVDSHLAKIIKSDYILNLLILPAILFCLVSTKEIIIVLLGSNWLKIELITKILLIGLLFRVNYKISLQYLKSQGFVKSTLFFNLRYLFVTVTLMIVFSRYDLIGLTIAYTLGLLFQYFQLQLKVKKVIPGYGFGLILKKNGRIILKFILLLTFFYFIKNTEIQKLNIYLLMIIKALIIVLFYIKELRYEIVKLYTVFIQKNKKNFKV